MQILSWEGASWQVNQEETTSVKYVNKNGV